MGTQELIIIGIVLLVLFGGSQVPKLARNLGKAQKEFKDGLSEGEREAQQRAAEQKLADEKLADQRLADQRLAEQRVAEQKVAEQRAAADPSDAPPPA